jgi:hypothetical protein
MNDQNKEKNKPVQPLIQLHLTVEEVNVVLQSLGNLPFNQVFDLIGKIHDQANSQTSPK